jgi:peptide deformylase
MATLTILEFPDPRLRTKAVPVNDVDDDLRALIDDMFETMYDAPGIGLAATQVDVHKQFLVMDCSTDKNAPKVFINPEILERRGMQIHEEGCLSVPGIYAEVERADEVVVRAMDRDGQPFETTLEGLEAVCLQHEMDHLEGKLFVDYLSPLKRQRVRKKLEKQRRQAEKEAAA